MVITVGESYDASYSHHTNLPPLLPTLYIFLGIWLSYSCIKIVEFHHPGFFFSMLFGLKRFVTSILVQDITGKAHSFVFAPYATVFNLTTQINFKFKITSDLQQVTYTGYQWVVNTMLI